MNNQRSLAHRTIQVDSGASGDAGGRSRQASSGRLYRCAAASAGLVVGSMVLASASAAATVVAVPVCPTGISDPDSRYLADAGIVEISGVRFDLAGCGGGNGVILDPTSRQYTALCIVEFPGVECDW